MGGRPGFDSLAALEHDDDGVHATLLKPLTYTSVDGRTFTVPAAFCTDGASIPRPLWTLVGSPLRGRYVRAAILHDYLYRRLDISKTEADLLFLEAMKLTEVNRVARYLIYSGVYVGGYWAWKANQCRPCA